MKWTEIKKKYVELALDKNLPIIMPWNRTYNKSFVNDCTLRNELLAHIAHIEIMLKNLASELEVSNTLIEKTPGREDYEDLDDRMDEVENTLKDVTPWTSEDIDKAVTDSMNDRINDVISGISNALREAANSIDYT